MLLPGSLPTASALAQCRTSLQAVPHARGNRRLSPPCVQARMPCNLARSHAACPAPPTAAPDC
eukprot:81641-Chlamydomonas_euryale.AAC.19